MRRSPWGYAGPVLRAWRSSRCCRVTMLLAPSWVPADLTRRRCCSATTPTGSPTTRWKQAIAANLAALGYRSVGHHHRPRRAQPVRRPPQRPVRAGCDGDPPPGETARPDARSSRPAARYLLDPVREARANTRFTRREEGSGGARSRSTSYAIDRRGVSLQRRLRFALVGPSCRTMRRVTRRATRLVYGPRSPRGSGVRRRSRSHNDRS